MSTESPIIERTPSGKSKRNRDADGSKSASSRRRHGNAEAETTETPRPSSKKSRRNHDTNHSTTQEPQDAATIASSDSPFFTQTTSLYLPLAPIAQRNPLEGLCAEHLSPLILAYFPPLKGIVLAYTNPRLSEKPSPGTSQTQILSHAVDEFAVTYVWLTADFTVLRAARGAWIEGHVTVQSPNHIGLVCWNLFSASIEKRRLPQTWRWSGRGGGKAALGQRQRAASVASTIHDDVEGGFVDENGAKVEGMIKFRIRDFDVAAESGKDTGFTSIEGTMLSEEEEKRLEKEVGLGGLQSMNPRLPLTSAVVA
jgi:DNA-directed RNA polymerase I subunit RPA43